MGCLKVVVNTAKKSEKIDDKWDTFTSLKDQLIRGCEINTFLKSL